MLYASCILPNTTPHAAMIRIACIALALLTLTACAKDSFIVKDELPADVATLNKAEQDFIKRLDERETALEQQWDARNISQEAYTRIGKKISEDRARSQERRSRLNNQAERVTASKGDPKLTKQRREWKGQLGRTILYNKRDLTEVREEYLLIDDLLKTRLMETFETSLFFPTGAYQIKPENRSAVKEAFDPMIENILRFTEGYSDDEIVVAVLVKGYADEQNFTADSEVAKTLRAEIGANATREQLNAELSKRRASALTGILQEAMLARKPEFKKQDNKVKFTIVPVGRGEAYPNPNVTDYKRADERRRIVTVSWDVYPQLFD